jgi:hypothetical protein
MRNVCTIALSLAALLLVAGPACAEQSVLSEDEASSLNEQNYRSEITSVDCCIVLFYRSDMNGTGGSDNVIKALKNNLPKDVRFFKVDLKNFSRGESEIIARNDIGRRVVPSIIPYKNGFPLSGKVLGPVRQEWINKIVEVYSKKYR